MKEDADYYESAANIPLDICIGPGCSIHKIDFSHATMRQLTALAIISGHSGHFFRVYMFNFQRIIVKIFRIM